MTTNPLISVIIPAYNAADTIAAAISSALAQTYRPLEILVVDDGSTDKTSQVADSFGDQIRFLSQANAGPAAARNLGLRESRGELIAFLDADDRWHPDKLALQWQILLQQPSVGLVHTEVSHFDLQSEVPWRVEVGRRNFVGNCTALLLQENRILNSSVVLRREYLDQTGFFDERFKGVEDYDLWLRLSGCCEFAYLDEPLVWYRHHVGSLSSYSTAMRAGELEVVQSAIARLRKSDSLAERNLAYDQKLNPRLQALHWDLGYDAYDRGDYLRARHHLGKCLRYWPFAFHAAILWCTTWLPHGLVSKLRRAKATLQKTLQSPLANSDA